MMKNLGVRELAWGFSIVFEFDMLKLLFHVVGLREWDLFGYGNFEGNVSCNLLLNLGWVVILSKFMGMLDVLKELWSCDVGMCNLFMWKL